MGSHSAFILQEVLRFLSLFLPASQDGIPPGCCNDVHFLFFLHNSAL